MGNAEVVTNEFLHPFSLTLSLSLDPPHCQSVGLRGKQTVDMAGRWRSLSCLSSHCSSVSAIRCCCNFLDEGEHLAHLVGRARVRLLKKHNPNIFTRRAVEISLRRQLGNSGCGHGTLPTFPPLWPENTDLKRTFFPTVLRR